MISGVADMEHKASLSPTDKMVAKHMEQKTYDLDKDLREYHYSHLDLMEEDEDFDGEQAILDEHEEKISNILDCLYVLLNPTKPTIGVFADPRHHMHVEKHLSHVDNRLARISDELKEVKPGPNTDCCLLEQLDEPTKSAFACTNDKGPLWTICHGTHKTKGEPGDQF